VIDLRSRRVHIAGISNQPSGAWMNQIARNMTDCVDGFLRGKRYLILDRDPLCTRVPLDARGCRCCQRGVRFSTRSRSDSFYP
jgi:hypothetical protein